MERTGVGFIPPVVRPGRPEDLEALLALALAAGTGLTNLPPDREVLARKLADGEAALVNEAAREAGAAVMLVTEHAGRIVGTGAIFARVGADWPFYSYRLTRQAQTSRVVRRSIAQRLLHLANDFDGEAEVGGLFVDPAARGSALGALTARARYLFIAQHRSWFRRCVLAELRGWQDDVGRSPVWEALGRHFYGMDFHEADRVNATQGNQFIADLGPRHPIYVSLLPPDAQAALGRPHDDGRRAYAMLIEEGFRDEGYVDIFDGGPTLTADIDRLHTIRDSRETRAAPVPPDMPAGERHLVATGEGAAFRATAAACVEREGELLLDAATLTALGIAPGGRVRYATAITRAPADQASAFEPTRKVPA